MRKSKIIAVVMVMTMALGVLSGCGIKYDMVVNKDLSGTETISYYYTEEELRQMAEDNETTFEEEIEGLVFTNYNGKDYYVDSSTVDLTPDDVNNEFSSFNKNHAVIAANSTAEEKTMKATRSTEYSPEEDFELTDFVESTYSFPYNVVKTNAKLLEDGKTIMLDNELSESPDRVYAIFNEQAANSKKVTYTGALNNKMYRAKKYLTINSSNVIKSVVIYRNGKVYKDDAIYFINGKKYDGIYNKFAFVKDGKYTVKTILINNHVATLKFTIDRYKPTTNMKAVTYKYKKAGRKITFKDATSGVKKATLNGKTIKSGKKVKAKGRYKLVIKDKAGNIRTVNFTIK